MARNSTTAYVPKEFRTRLHAWLQQLEYPVQLDQMDNQVKAVAAIAIPENSQAQLALFQLMSERIQKWSQNGNAPIAPTTKSK